MEALLILFNLFHVSICAENYFDDRSCRLDMEMQRPQVSILIERSARTQPHIGSLPKMLKEFTSFVKSQNEHAEFSLSYFAPWKITTKTEDNDCYDRQIGFTGDVQKFMSQVKLPTSFPKDDTPWDNIFDASSFSVTDEDAGWIPHDIDKSGRRIRRIVVVISDENIRYTRDHKNAARKHRTVFVGNGSDSCAKSMPVSNEAFHQIMQDKRVCFICWHGGVYEEAISDCFRRNRVLNYLKRHKGGNIFNSFISYAQDAYLSCMRCVFSDPNPYFTLGL